MSETQAARVRLRLHVRGRVQGVWFRGWTCEQARALGLAGFAKNLHDGSVEVVAQGTRGATQALVEACRKGPPSARVDAVTFAEEAPDDALAGFRIL
ncbi:MAG: acylphosphatase [Deltaproteobacteria bacterium]|nr:acylphosphatase [Deltaproteobacteria bacterium]